MLVRSFFILTHKPQSESDSDSWFGSWDGSLSVFKTLLAQVRSNSSFYRNIYSLLNNFLLFWRYGFSLIRMNGFVEKLVGRFTLYYKEFESWPVLEEGNKIPIDMSRADMLDGIKTGHKLFEEMTERNEVVIYLAIFINTNLLHRANVDMFIMFRLLTTILVVIAETFRKQQCLSKLTFLALVIILVSAIGYVVNDSVFTLAAYSWAFAYWVTTTTEMVFNKHGVMNLGLNSCGFLLYNNLWSLMLAPLFWVVTGRYSDAFAAQWVFYEVSEKSVVLAGADLRSLKKGEEIHSYTVIMEGIANVLVANALVDIYAKCGSLEGAERLFDSILEKDVYTGNSVIGGYTLAGYYGKAYELFLKVETLGICWNAVTWNAVVNVLNSLDKRLLFTWDGVQQQGLGNIIISNRAVMVVPFNSPDKFLSDDQLVDLLHTIFVKYTDACTETQWIIDPEILNQIDFVDNGLANKYSKWMLNIHCYINEVIDKNQDQYHFSSHQVFHLDVKAQHYCGSPVIVMIRSTMSSTICFFFNPTKVTLQSIVVILYHCDYSAGIPCHANSRRKKKSSLLPASPHALDGSSHVRCKVDHPLQLLYGKQSLLVPSSQQYSMVGNLHHSDSQ